MPRACLINNCYCAKYLTCGRDLEPRHCGLDPQSPEIGRFQGIPGQARDDDLALLV